MTCDRPALDLAAVQRATSHAVDAVVAAARCTSDADKLARRARGECRACYYLRSRRAGGAQVTTRPCGLCGTVIVSGNTFVNQLCPACGRKHGLCVVCAADLKEREGRRKL